MKIELKEIKIRDLFKGYIDKAEDGVVGYGGLLNIRPPYQREFVYKDSQRDAVIDTVRKDFPLNVMYWVKSKDEDENDNFEVLDGQQRTISICSYINGDYSINYQYFHNLEDDEKEQILNYPLMVYFCEGTDKEKLDWFKTINIAGEKLTPQELRNAVYTGPWLSDAKRYFSKTNCAAYRLGDKYIKAVPIRQEYLETVISWIADRDGIAIEEYMGRHQHNKDASELWTYYQQVINWIKLLFPEENYRKEMKGLPWGLFYNRYKDKVFNPNDLEKELIKLMSDEDVTNKKGAYLYLIDKEEKHLSLRAFTDKQKREKYEEQKYICPHCHSEGNDQEWKFEEMEGDHITPWSEGGHTTIDNLQMLCKKHNRTKSNK